MIVEETVKFKNITPFDPIMIAKIRRIMPSVIAQDIIGVSGTGVSLFSAILKELDDLRLPDVD
jgi:hypothetical protein